MNRMWQLHIIQHKRFVPYGTHPNSCIAKTPFMLETLYLITATVGKNHDD